MWNQEIYLKTIDFAAKAHENQVYSGRGYNYIVHPVSVAMEALKGHLLEPCNDIDLLLQCSLLHDVLEDTEIEPGKLSFMFGDLVLQGVQALTKNKSLEKKDQMTDSLERIVKQPAEIAMVKMADRICNLQKPPDSWSLDKRKMYLEEASVIVSALGAKHRALEKHFYEKMEMYKEYL